MRGGRRRLPAIAAIVLSLAVLYAAAVGRLNAVPRASVVEEMQVALPRFIQVVATAGDRYLAANIATFRSLVASTEHMHPDNYKVQGILQSDAAWLNPAQEDNYYIAAAILPWNGELDAGQYVLEKADTARPFDWQPMFYRAFNIYYFQRDPVRAATLLTQVAPRVRSENDRYSLETIASFWFEKGYDARTAVSAIEAMAAEARSGRFKEYLQMRAGRLRGLLTLQEAARAFNESHGRQITALEELVDAGLIVAIPDDPFGFGYDIGRDGVPVLLNAPRGRSE